MSIDGHTHISRNVVNHTVNHNARGDFLPCDTEDILNAVSIGRYVWIWDERQRSPGVTMDDGAVIGVGTVISKNVLPSDIVVGTTQRVVGHRDPEINRLLVEDKKFYV